MATIYDVARMAGVSISTVSLALNDSDRVSPEKHSRIREAAKAVGYSPNPVARSLQSGRTRFIALVIGDFVNPFQGSLLHVVERRAWQEDYLVIVCDTGDDATRERLVIEQLGRQRVAGMILFSNGHGPEHLAFLRGLRMPLVLVDQKHEGLEHDFVGADNELASATLAGHLLELGHRRIGYIGGPENLPTARQRLTGFRSAMAEAGVPVDDRDIANGEYNYETARLVASRMLARRTRPTAIVAANNVMGLGALKAVREAGLQCPGDISLTCIDSVPWAEALQPTLTAVLQPVNEMARVASECLLERIGAPDGRSIPARSHILKPRLVLGQSSAPPPVRRRQPRPSDAR